MRIVLIVVVALVLTGCGTDSDTADPSDPSSAPSSSLSSTPPPTAPPTSSPTSSSAPPCDVVTDEDATSWAGTPQTVSGPEQVGAIQRCSTVVDVSDSLGLTWAFGDAAPLETLVEQENVDGSLEREDIELDGGTPAVLLTGQVVGTAFTQVVTVLDDDRSLVVEARDTGLGESPRSVKELGAVATKVAEAYSR